MKFVIDRQKSAIRSGEIFAGLSVDMPERFKRIFMGRNFHLLTCWDGDNLAGYAVFEVVGYEVMFWLINCQNQKAEIVKPLFDFTRALCRASGWFSIYASAERPAMGRHLRAIGFDNVFETLYRAEVR